jgi:uncharacterized membrane protein YdjX (TVP38/TMEM64 family)
MVEFLTDMTTYFSDILNDAGALAPFLSTLLIYLEGILAFLPLFVFVGINTVTMGPILGNLLAWVATVLGCFTTFLLTSSILSDWVYDHIKDSEKLLRFHDLVKNLKFRQLVLLIAIPFVPSFFMNVGAGLAKISKKKYFTALLLGKIFVVIFLSYVCTSLIESITNPIKLLEVLGLIVAAYLIARIVNKKFNIDKEF